jgi:CheY-like chemotaxis protein
MWKRKPIDHKLVLVTDDDSDAREALATLLVAAGYSVLEADNGKRALELLMQDGSHFPRVILLDLAMPVMDGYKFLEMRAADPILSHIPVIVISGNSRAAEPLDAVNTFLRKPVDVERLLAVIRAVRPTA